MLNALTSYQFDDIPVRVIAIQGEPWFVATDVAAVLGYRDAPNLTRILDNDERGTHIVSTLSGDQSLTIISESGLYAAIFKSRREEAQRFRRWVTGEVLPTLRRTGRYELFDEPPMPPQLPSPAIDDADMGRLNTAVGIMREARQIWGREDCRRIWVNIGLPSPLADAVETADDPFADRIAQLIEDKECVTVAEAAGMLGVQQHDVKLALRIGAALRLLGWSPRNERREGGVVKVWRRIPRAIHAAVAAQAEG